MLSEFVEEDMFLKGVSIYLKKHLYGSTVSRDLWEGVAEATGIQILLPLRHNLNYIFLLMCSRARYSKDDGHLGIQSKLVVFDSRLSFRLSIMDL
jgi:hypothetical protein